MRAVRETARDYSLLMSQHHALTREGVVSSRALLETFVSGRDPSPPGGRPLNVARPSTGQQDS
jgi:hypothetical protein